MGAKSIVATFFNCRDRKGSNFFSIKGRREINIVMKRQLYTLLKYLAAVAYTLSIFCKPNLKSVGFCQKNNLLSLLKET
jgi:hypothetical protein